MLAGPSCPPHYVCGGRSRSSPPASLSRRVALGALAVALWVRSRLTEKRRETTASHQAPSAPLGSAAGEEEMLVRVAQDHEDRGADDSHKHEGVTFNTIKQPPPSSALKPIGGLFDHLLDHSV